MSELGLLKGRARIYLENHRSHKCHSTTQDTLQYGWQNTEAAFLELPIHHSQRLTSQCCFFSVTLTTGRVWHESNKCQELMRFVIYFVSLLSFLDFQCPSQPLSDKMFTFRIKLCTLINRFYVAKGIHQLAIILRIKEWALSQIINFIYFISLDENLRFSLHIKMVVSSIMLIYFDELPSFIYSKLSHNTLLVS